MVCAAQRQAAVLSQEVVAMVIQRGAVKQGLLSLNYIWKKSNREGRVCD